MKEDEAKTKWCPDARVSAGVQYTSANRRTPVYRDDPPTLCNGSTCIASACMAWRWISYLNNDGYCGRAGKE